MRTDTLLLALDLAGTFAFALTGALTAVRTARLDIVDVVTLGMITALGGGLIRDILLDALPPATFSDLRYLTVVCRRWIGRVRLKPAAGSAGHAITILDATGLSLFAVTGAHKALTLGFGVIHA